MECVSFALIVDDIVLPNGETNLEALGGGGGQALFGYQLVTGQEVTVGLCAGVGPDLPQKCTVWRVPGDPCERMYDMMDRFGPLEALPPRFQSCPNYHLGVHPQQPPLGFMQALRSAAHRNGGFLSVESYAEAEDAIRPERVLELLRRCDVFSPNDQEARSLVGPGNPEELALRLLSLSPPGGADVVAVPAVADTRVVDVTGCGNAFCGGFLAALYRGGRAVGKGTDPRPNNDVSGSDGGGSPAAGPPSWLGRSDLATAGAWGCVAASFMAEERGVPLTPIPQLQEAARRRLLELLPRVRALELSLAPRAPHDDDERPDAAASGPGNLRCSVQ
ncbi:hypothetical protein GPECTOR_34g764 [Gonium pectorale]|uniref:Uncharacterized protein n=1 Tax=Gonium pectorale TaxID=33097 RepID=A0A150GDE3_GONPE|nr:hypothetical protein GPECTOR_34g764 [Gonium pectorale]|eukprot:KXZ47605.1 hypothetical protein GPECTOR_34g764 [Gonium pectorale]